MSVSNEKPVFRLSQLTAQPMDWLWPGRIAAGALALLDGDPGQGKSLVALDLAARLSSGRVLPESQAHPGPSSVVLLTSEDSLQQTVLPRLQAADADLDKIHVFRTRSVDGLERAPSFPEDCDLLAEIIRNAEARFVIIDPFLAFLSAGICSLNDQIVRRALGPLARVAEETGVAILLIRHLIKWGQSQRALCRGTGAMAIIGAARTALLAGSHPDDAQLHLLASTKNNLASPPPTLAYRIGQSAPGQAVVEWAGPAPHTADDILRGPGRPQDSAPTALSEAVALLKELLAHGPATRETVLRQARAAGLADRTLERAKAQLQVRSQPRHEHGRNVWYWHLPSPADGGGDSE